MMLNFYLIILLICIDWTFSYDRLDNPTVRYPAKTMKLGRKNAKNKLIRQKNYEEMADFYIKPDEILNKEVAGIRNIEISRQPASNEYDYVYLVDKYANDNNKKKEKDLEEDNFEASNALEESIKKPDDKDFANPKSVASNTLDDIRAKSEDPFNEKAKNMYRDVAAQTNPVHHTAKKCAFKRIQIPFFFHKKHDQASSSKSSKKRKLFGFKPKNPTAVHAAQKNRTTDDPLLAYKVKRSFEKKIRPVTQMQLNAINVDRPKKTPASIIHNSRQFFQKHSVYSPIDNLKRRLDDFEDLVNEFSRKKRENPSEEERMKQLRELDEVQRRIDNAEILQSSAVKLPPSL